MASAPYMFTKRGVGSLLNASILIYERVHPLQFVLVRCH